MNDIESAQHDHPLHSFVHADIKNSSASTDPQSNTSSIIEEQAERLVRLQLSGSSSIAGCSASTEKGGAASVAHAPFDLSMAGNAHISSNAADMQEGGAIAVATSVSATLTLTSNTSVENNSGSGKAGSVVYITNAASEGGSSKLPSVAVRLSGHAAVRDNAGVGLVVDSVSQLDMQLLDNSAISSNDLGGLDARRVSSFALDLAGEASISHNKGPAATLQKVSSASISLHNSSHINSNKAVEDAGIALLGASNLQVNAWKWADHRKACYGLHISTTWILSWCTQLGLSDTTTMAGNMADGSCIIAAKESSQASIMVSGHASVHSNKAGSVSRGHSLTGTSGCWRIILTLASLVTLSMVHPMYCRSAAGCASWSSQEPSLQSVALPSLQTTPRCLEVL